VFNPQTAPYYPAFRRDFKGAAATPAAALSATPVRDEAAVERDASAFARVPGGALIAAPDPFMNTHRALVVALAERYRLPVDLWCSAFRQGWRPDLIRAGHARDRPPLGVIRRPHLRGERPGELPVQAPTKYELLINLETANSVPVTLRVRADRVVG
jgi:putative tryptophan/tyrosine transport system substrate-binding protein